MDRREVVNNRQYEITLVLKDLVKQVKVVVKNCDYVDDVKRVSEHTNKIVSLSKKMEEYNNELNSLR